MRRSILFLPGNTPNIIVNGEILGADAVILDLEDAVAPAEKDSARILVRNAIVLLDYAEELRNQGQPMVQAVLNASKRRMRPIFLTSAAATMGVLPMGIGNSALWKPMGVVIFWGTPVTMIFILTVIPVAYAMMKGRQKGADQPPTEPMETHLL